MKIDESGRVVGSILRRQKTSKWNTYFYIIEKNQFEVYIRICGYGGGCTVYGVRITKSSNITILNDSFF